MAARSEAMRFLKEMPGIIFPILLVTMLAGIGLKLLGAVPSYIRGGPPVESYATLEEAELALRMDILLPAYFPDYIRWPPAAITAQKEPGVMVSLLFLTRDGSRKAMWVHEIMPPSLDLEASIPEPKQVWRRTTVTMNGEEGWLLLGRDEEGYPSNQLRWPARGGFFIVTTIYPEEELVRIAQSMHP